ncbi:MAG: hypothetical protein D6707_08905 [Bacteroidetes bacterium]|nr:MAG: hypothetical protein D6707_08905 [Bacteroidota bacterium]
MFYTNSPSKKWNGTNWKGKRVKDGEYHWVVEYVPECIGGDGIIRKEGTVKVYSADGKKK